MFSSQPIRSYGFGVSLIFDPSVDPKNRYTPIMKTPTWESMLATMDAKLILVDCLELCLFIFQPIVIGR